MEHIQDDTKVSIHWQYQDGTRVAVIDIEAGQCRVHLFMRTPENAYKMFAAIREIVDTYAKEASGNPPVEPRHERPVTAGGKLIA